MCEVCLHADCLCLFTRDEKWQINQEQELFFSQVIKGRSHKIHCSDLDELLLSTAGPTGAPDVKGPTACLHKHTRSKEYLRSVCIKILCKLEMNYWIFFSHCSALH